MCFEVLVVEDNTQEARIIEESFKTACPQCSLRLIINCRTVVDFLHAEQQKGGYRPDLILLDYRMPLNGGATLGKLKSDAKLQHIPVIIITGVADEQAIYDLYCRGANCCFEKPGDLRGYETLAGLVGTLLGTMLLPAARGVKTASRSVWRRNET